MLVLVFNVLVQSLDARFSSGTGPPGYFTFCLFPFSRPPSGGLLEDGEIRRLCRSHHCMFFLMFNICGGRHVEKAQVLICP